MARSKKSASNIPRPSLVRIPPKLSANLVKPSPSQNINRRFALLTKKSSSSGGKRLTGIRWGGNFFLKAPSSKEKKKFVIDIRPGCPIGDARAPRVGIGKKGLWDYAKKK